MDIVYLGHSSFRIKGKDGSLVTDPFDPVMVGFKFTKCEADIVTISHNHEDHNKTDFVANKKFVIDKAGEYEISGISIIGIEVDHDTTGGGERGKNVIFIFEVDGIRIAHLGDLGHKLPDKIMEQIGDIDVLILPVGGVFTIGAKDAAEVAKTFDSPYVLPMHYKAEGINQETFGKLAPVEDFLKESGYEVEKADKLTIKKELINYEQNKVVLLERK